MSFSGVDLVPPDAIFNIVTMYKADPAELKLNLGVGAYRTDEGEPLVLNVVKKAEKAITEQLCEQNINLEYLPIDGLAAFREETVKLILGSESKAVAEDRVACCQSLSGTGALRMGAEFVAVNLGQQSKVYQYAPLLTPAVAFAPDHAACLAPGPTQHGATTKQFLLRRDWRCCSTATSNQKLRV